MSENTKSGIFFENSTFGGTYLGHFGFRKCEIFKNGKYKDAIRMGITRARYNELIQIANK